MLDQVRQVHREPRRHLYNHVAFIKIIKKYIMNVFCIMSILAEEILLKRDATKLDNFSGSGTCTNVPKFAGEQATYLHPSVLCETWKVLKTTIFKFVKYHVRLHYN